MGLPDHDGHKTMEATPLSPSLRLILPPTCDFLLSLTVRLWNLPKTAKGLWPPNVFEHLSCRIRIWAFERSYTTNIRPPDFPRGWRGDLVCELHSCQNKLPLVFQVPIERSVTHNVNVGEWMAEWLELLGHHPSLLQ
jgi:hypothetical protein